MIEENIKRLTDLRDGQSGIIIDIDMMPMRRRMRRKWGETRGNNDIFLFEVGLDNEYENCEFQQNEACQNLSAQSKLSSAQRLMDLGLTPGTKIVVVKSAPFKGPLEVLVRGARMALGREIASRISVELI